MRGAFSSFHDRQKSANRDAAVSALVRKTMTSSAAWSTRVAVYVALLLLSIIFHCSVVNAACQSCLLSPIPGIARQLHHHHRHGHLPANGQASWTFGAFAATRHFLLVLDNRHRRFLESSEDSDGDRAKGDSSQQPKEGAAEGAEVEVTAAMVSAIGFYKKFISPLLPPACRFLPTCSQYGVQAIEEFGPQKGAILTAWRLLRCSPFGGRGYDPPRWPPVAYNYGSY